LALFSLGKYLRQLKCFNAKTFVIAAVFLIVLLGFSVRQLRQVGLRGSADRRDAVTKKARSVTSLYKVTHVERKTYTTAAMVAPSSPTPASPPPSDPQRTVEARAAFTAHLTSIGNSHISALEQRVSDIHSNSLNISKQEDEIEKQTKKLADESKKHQKVADDAGAKLKELGDIQNWAEVLERDLLVLETAMKMGEGEEEGEVVGEGRTEVDCNGVAKGKGKGEEEGRKEGKREAAVRA